MSFLVNLLKDIVIFINNMNIISVECMYMYKLLISKVDNDQDCDNIVRNVRIKN